MVQLSPAGALAEQELDQLEPYILIQLSSKSMRVPWSCDSDIKSQREYLESTVRLSFFKSWQQAATNGKRRGDAKWNRILFKFKDGLK